jgi:NAD/NADP transhydrogenase beta subunit
MKVTRAYLCLCLSLGGIALSALTNLYILSVPVEAFLAILGLPSGWPARLLAALSVTGMLSVLGAKYAVARRNGEPAWVFPPVALAIAAAVGAAVWETTRAAACPEPMALALGLFGLAGAALAFLYGTGLEEALDALTRRGDR